MANGTILVATDFSARADRALDRALLLGEQRGSPVKLVHAMDHIVADNADWAELDLRMEALVGDAPCPTSYAYPEGSPPVAIAQAASANDVEMLVIGPARYNSLGDYFLGTAVDYVLRHTECPTLVVKQRARAPYSHIVAGTDFSDASAHAIIEAVKLFPDIPVHVVHAWHVPFEGFQRDQYVREEVEAGERKLLDEFMAKLEERAPELAGATSRLVRGGPHQAFTEELGQHRNSHGNTLVVVGSHGTSGFRQAAIGSVTSDLLRTLDSDVLVVNTKKAES